MNDDVLLALAAIAFWIALWAIFIVGTVGAWLTHLYICFTTGEWGFLIAGAIFFPIALVHGWGHWLGLW